MSIGERIRYLRLKRGMTQQYLGEKAGFEPGTAAIRMAQYESGKRSPKEEITRNLADALDVKPSWLMCMDDDPVRELARQTAEHQRLLELWDRADEIDRNTIWSILSRYDEKGAGSSASAG